MNKTQIALVWLSGLAVGLSALAFKKRPVVVELADDDLLTLQNSALKQRDVTFNFSALTPSEKHDFLSEVGHRVPDTILATVNDTLHVSLSLVAIQALAMRFNKLKATDGSGNAFDFSSFN